MKLHSFQSLVSRIIHLSTRDGKPIPITFSGTDAFTSTKSVNIPTLPSGTILSQNQFSIWLGYVIHEGPGHQSHTDLFLYEQTCKQRKNPTFSYILNLLEDIRIENADISLYPGDRKYLDAVHHFVDNKIPTHLAQNPDIMGLIYKHLFVNHRNLDTNIIQGTLDPKIATLISEIDSCFSTQDCITLADKVVDYLKKNNNTQETKPQPSLEGNENERNYSSISSSSSRNRTSTNNNSILQQSNSNQGDQTNDQGNSNQELEEEINNESNNNPNLPINSNNSSQLSNKSNQSRSENSNPSDQSKLWQEITEIKNIIKELQNQNSTLSAQSYVTQSQRHITHNPSQTIPNQDLSNKSIFPPVNILNDKIYVPSRENLGAYNSTRNSCSSQILALKKMFRIYLQAKTQKATIRGLEDGKLDHHRLHSVATGSNLIFKDSSSKLLPETALELMIDMSGSMNSEIARTSAIILAEALNSIPQIKLSISGFTTNDSNSHRNYSFNTPPNSGRNNGMDILLFKDFSIPYQKSKAKLGAITNSGLTPLGDAYGKALEHIIPRPEPRRIIFLITDGTPEFSHGKNYSDFLLMQRIHASAQKFKIQTLALGIGEDLEFLNNYFDAYVNITQTQELPKNLLEALKRFI